jgi:hypothetical protein
MAATNAGGASLGTDVTMPFSRRGWTLALAGLGAFLCSLDVVVVATALPALRTHLGASLSDLERTINAYNLAFACSMLTGRNWDVDVQHAFHWIREALLHPLRSE